MKQCPALFISAPASSQGKTTVTAALARFHRDLGRRVRVFKTGPDFLDPLILQQASSAPVYQLDLWMGGEGHCRQHLYDAATEADLILIEGVMGLYDGDPASADLAMLFGIPVLAVIDGSAMAQTFGAVAQGLASYRPGLLFAGVFANRVAGEGHYQMLAESLPETIQPRGWLARNEDISLPERHLGLLQASEMSDFEARISLTAAALNGINDTLPPAVTFQPGESSHHKPLLQGIRVAIAQDVAFAFLYRANIDCLRSLGAEICFFSPLSDSELPETDALYLPGGYPELHLEKLAANQSMQDAIRAHYLVDKPLLAECGGMLYLLESLENHQGQRAGMAGLLPGKAVMQSRLVNLGLHSACLPEGELRGHTFHHSSLSCDLNAVVCTEPAGFHGTPEPVFRQRRLTASYLHFYFPSNLEATARLFLP